MADFKSDNIFILWFLWQFYEMPKFLLLVWKNFLMFASNYFSVPLLLKTLFAPWKKYNWVYPKNFDIQQILETFISNIFSRIIGAVMRTVLILMGIIFQILVLTVGLIIFVFWILVPFIIIFGVILFLSL